MLSLILVECLTASAVETWQAASSVPRLAPHKTKPASRCGCRQSKSVYMTGRRIATDVLWRRSRAQGHSLPVLFVSAARFAHDLVCIGCSRHLVWWGCHFRQGSSKPFRAQTDESKLVGSN